MISSKFRERAMMAISKILWDSPFIGPLLFLTVYQIDRQVKKGEKIIKTKQNKEITEKEFQLALFARMMSGERIENPDYELKPSDYVSHRAIARLLQEQDRCYVKGYDFQTNQPRFEEYPSNELWEEKMAFALRVIREGCDDGLLDLLERQKREGLC